MMGRLKAFIIGIAAGCLSWAICPLVSDRIEPFDTDVGLWGGQMLLAFCAIYLAANSNARALLVGVLGMYVGQNIYASVVGDASWFVLGLITIAFLCIIPLVVGFMTLIAIASFRRIKSNGA